MEELNISTPKIHERIFRNPYFAQELRRKLRIRHADNVRFLEILDDIDDRTLIEQHLKHEAQKQFIVVQKKQRTEQSEETQELKRLFERL